MKTQIKFGTDGWRAIIAREYTVENVARVSQATAKWLKQQENHSGVVIGHDCRFGGELFSETAAMVFANEGIAVKLADAFASTPMVSLATRHYNASLGIVITASHNPPSYNGYKLKGSYGGPLLPEQVAEIEAMIPDESSFDPGQVYLEDFIKSGRITKVNLEELYISHAGKSFDLNKIRSSNIKFAYDAMFGAGQQVMQKLFPDMDYLHCEINPSFKGTAPEPIDRNLSELSAHIKAANGNIAIGIATDGDADRIGLYDSKGRFVDSHHIILLLIHYLVKYKGMQGKVVTAFSVTERIKKMCRHYNLDLQVVKIGFKYICGIMIEEDVLLGGEESGGIAIKGHIPERDGIWIALVLMEFMATTGKSLEDLIDEVYSIVGPFAFERSDLHLREDQKEKIMALCRENAYQQFGEYKVDHIETTDGFKFYFNDNEWLMIRPSGTEPVLRTYAESNTRDDAFKILEATRKKLLA